MEIQMVIPILIWYQDRHKYTKKHLSLAGAFLNGRNQMGEIIRYSNGKIYIPPDEVERARQIGCLEYFRRSRNAELKRVGRDYCIKDHDSFRMSENGKWVWYSRNEGGNDAISYLMKIEGRTFQEACIEVLNAVPVNNEIRARQPQDDQPRKLDLPLKDDDSSMIRNYLIGKRAIDPEIVDYFIAKGDIYQDKKYKSVCFVGRDKDGIPRIVNVRGISSSFQNTAPGSDRSFGFNQYYAEKNSLHIFEAPIDMLSYLTIIKESGLNFKNFNMLSLSGIYSAKDVENSKKPKGLEKFLEEHQHIKEIYIHFDNDGAGINAAKAVMYLYQDYKVENQPPPKTYKDVNEYLINRDIRNVSRANGNDYRGR